MPCAGPGISGGQGGLGISCFFSRGGLKKQEIPNPRVPLACATGHQWDPASSSCPPLCAGACAPCSYGASAPSLSIGVQSHSHQVEQLLLPCPWCRGWRSPPIRRFCCYGWRFTPIRRYCCCYWHRLLWAWQSERSPGPRRTPGTNCSCASGILAYVCMQFAENSFSSSSKDQPTPGV